jgi:hypothetical protein
VVIEDGLRDQVLANRPAASPLRTGCNAVRRPTIVGALRRMHGRDAQI